MGTYRLGLNKFWLEKIEIKNNACEEAEIPLCIRVYIEL